MDKVLKTLYGEYMRQNRMKLISIEIKAQEAERCSRELLEIS